jgi:hypothetical protein|tara:strand:- start:596 stop:784 length:189 start_codon:yes stop_codon:yes gene_type:complete
MYKITPTATGGKLINELNIIVIKLFPVKFLIESIEAIGKDIKIDMIRADNDIYKDKPITSNK